MVPTHRNLEGIVIIHTMDFFIAFNNTRDRRLPSSIGRTWGNKGPIFTSDDGMDSEVRPPRE